jgi:CHAT domain-containing protein
MDWDGAKALRQAELAMLKPKGRRHPFYWASLDGQT